MSRLLRTALAALSLVAVIALPATVHAAPPTKVAIIVGPVGSLTPTYLALAEAAAATAEGHGASVARAYSPHATPGNVLAAVADANVIIYFGHGYGHPSPYGGLNTAKQNGWALQGPGARGTHADGGSQLQYLGEDWVVANARPAPGFVMIYSNTCYAPGASEGGHAPADAFTAAQRVAFYSRKVFTMGGSAFFATDFDRGAADLVGRLLADRGATFGSAFASDARFVPSGLTTQAHHFSPGQSIWLHRSKYTDGPPNYWYAFAGNPDVSPLRAWDRAAPTATLTSPTPGAQDVLPSASITLQLSEAVHGVGNATLSLTDAAGGVVPATVAYDATSRIATIVPAAPLALSSRYSVNVAQGVSDDAGRPLVATTWSFITRLDADPLSSRLPIVLERGAHELLRLGSDGSTAATQTLEVADRQWLRADRRARLVGRPGTWLRFDDATLGAWWVAESRAAHAIGQVEDVLLEPGTEIALPAGSHQLHAFGPEGLAGVEHVSVSGSRVAVVDRRRVVEGRTMVRLAAGELAGGWVAIDPVAIPTEPRVRRLLAIEPRAATARIVLASGSHAAFRFADDGRVLARLALAHEQVPAAGLTTNESRVIGGRRFSVIADGELAGWGLAQEAGLQVLPIADGRDAAD